MCGIVGFVDNSKNKKKIIKQMADLIKHRGPDSEGFYTNDKVALGFRRLSIIDLEGGNQPIFNEDQTKLVFMNGEIYNYQLLKEDKSKKLALLEIRTHALAYLKGMPDAKNIKDLICKVKTEEELLKVLDDYQITLETNKNG